MTKISNSDDLLRVLDSDAALMAAFVRQNMWQLLELEIIQIKTRVERGLAEHALEMTDPQQRDATNNTNEGLIEHFHNEKKVREAILGLMKSALRDESMTCEFFKGHYGLDISPFFDNANNDEAVLLVIQDILRSHIHSHAFNPTTWQGKEAEALDLYDQLPIAVQQDYTREAAALAAKLCEPAIVWCGTLESAELARSVG